MKKGTKRNYGGFVRAVCAAAAFMLAAAACQPGKINYPEPPYPKPEPPPEGYVWSELPVIDANLPPTQTVVKHFFDNAAGKRTRNFTLLYDKDLKLALWVAYPMHKIYFGTYGRLDNFSYDPLIPSQYQMPITGTNTYGKYPYQRGHQIASADRTVTRLANDQTFFVTNMTPQNGTLNGGQWADLELWIRGRASQSGRYDTLYVVTGCIPGNSTITTRGVTGNIPRAYYKALMRTSSGYPKFPSDDDAQCIGFYMVNDYPDGSWKNYAMSVAEIEDLAGFTFFPALSRRTKAELRPQDWGLN